MRFIYSLLLLTCCILAPCYLRAQGNYEAPGNTNPIIPGYFADPTVKKFGDTYYIYATTDGNGGGLGPSQVWTSKDFVSWTMQDMNWPTTHNYWAPDVAYNNGKYYLYYCQPTVEVYGASSATPVGPWTPLFADGKAVVPDYLVPKVITLDGQTFQDDDGKFYMTWGTWGIYPGYGCGVGLLNPDMRSFAKTAQIPNTLAKDFFEGSFMFKRKGIYYLMYSSGFCENETYRVQYAMSKTGPMEGFTFGRNNPILSTSANGTVHGPGHNSVLHIGDDYYIIYHRHNNPHSGGGYNRQVCADKLVFDAEGNIEKVIPTHTGIGFLNKNAIPYPNLAYEGKVTASSYYSADYKPEFAVDDNNGTLWKPKYNSAKPAWLQVDLGKITAVKRVLTQFEYATWYYQYLIEYSTDGKKWQIFADKRASHWHGSPAVDEGNIKARYMRLTITGTEYPGLYKAVWNLRVYGAGPAITVPENLHNRPLAEKYMQKGLLINIDAANLQPGTTVKDWKNDGALGGIFTTGSKAPVADFIAGKKAIMFTGTESLTSTFNVPLSLAGNNSYTVCYWVYTSKLKDENPLLSWTNSTEQLTGATFGYGNNRDFGAAQHFGFADIPYTKSNQLAGKWHYVAVTFDGTFEKVYIDGVLNNSENKMLFVQCATNFTLGSNNAQTYFSGAIASLQVYDRPLSESEIKQLYADIKPSRIAVYFDAAKLPYGNLQNWANEGETGGSLKPGAKTIVTDVAGRISVKFPEKTSLTLSEPLNMNTNYSIVVSEFNTNSPNSKWHLIIKTYDGKSYKDFIDGMPAVNTDELHINKADNAIEGLSGAIASLSICKYTLNSDEVKALNTLWQENLHSPIDTTLYFKQNPKAITPGMIRMQAGGYSKNTSLKYDFTRLVNDTPFKQSGWVENPYYVDYGLSPDQHYGYTYKVRDNAGNVTESSTVFKAATSSSQFTIYADGFTKQQDYLLNGTSGTTWDGIVGNGEKQSAKAIVAKGDDTLKLVSENTNWDGASPYGPFIYKNVSGDFVAEVEVSNVSGLADKKVTGNNDAGLMVRLAAGLADNTHPEQLMQNSVFPAWNVGNMFTNFMDGDRRQTNIQSAWNYNKYLQIQREGNWFYIRTSTDDINWVDLPGSPTLRKDLNKKEVQVGLYQCTYGPKEGFASFSNFKLVLSK